MSKHIGKEFMNKTQYKYLTESDQRKGVDPPLLQLEYDKSKTLIDLPKPEDLNLEKLDIKDAIENRNSIRKYSDKPLTLEELSWLLWATQGVKEIHDKKVYTKRTVPSAGARHAFETYVLVNNVEGLFPGVYRYLALEHKLIDYILDEGIAEKLAEAAYGQSMVMNGNATFIWVAVPYRIA